MHQITLPMIVLMRMLLQSEKPKIKYHFTGLDLYLNKPMFDKYGLFFYLYGTRHGVDFDRLDAGLPKRNDEADAVSIDKNKNVIPTSTRGTATLAMVKMVPWFLTTTIHLMSHHLNKRIYKNSTC